MHYANGKPARNGDVVLQIEYGKPVIAVLYEAQAGNDYCNGKLAPILPQGGACLAYCVHLDDVLKCLGIDVNGSAIRDQLSRIPRAS
jgi:hypothetical protein